MKNLKPSMKMKNLDAYIDKLIDDIAKMAHRLGQRERRLLQISKKNTGRKVRDERRKTIEEGRLSTIVHR